MNNCHALPLRNITLFSRNGAAQTVDKYCTVQQLSNSWATVKIIFLASATTKKQPNGEWSWEATHTHTHTESIVHKVCVLQCRPTHKRTVKKVVIGVQRFSAELDISSIAQRQSARMIRGEMWKGLLYYREHLSQKLKLGNVSQICSSWLPTLVVFSLNNVMNKLYNLILLIYSA